MLIDINSYIGNWPYRKLRGTTLNSLLERMNHYGVDKSVVANINGIFYMDCQSANEELYAEIQAQKGHKNRFIPFATLNPLLPWWKQSLDICHNEFGMKGIRLYPLYHKYKLTDKSCIDLVKAAHSYNMPVSIPLRMTDLRERSWLDVDEEMNYNDIAVLVKEVPDAQYMILDARITEHAPITTDESINILKNANVLFDSVRSSGVPVAGINGESLLYLINTFGKDKIAFGTETPFLDYCSPFIRVAVLEEADEATKNMIWSENARRMLRI
ncbi:MAG TPA: hypothetical protein VNT20_21345 [Flavisolibacter sp.]|jgi:uncharacterized protein|nr:hypothetical protein [Flavisolibacter sp.]